MRGETRRDNATTTGLGYSVHEATTTIDAPVDVVWSVLSDLESIPRWNSAVTSVERIAIVDEEGKKSLSMADWQVGTTWYETYKFGKRDIVQHRTVTEMDVSNKKAWSLHINVDYPSKEERADSTIADAATTTLSYTIYPIKKDDDRAKVEKCRLVGTFAVFPADCGMRM